MKVNKICLKCFELKYSQINIQPCWISAHKNTMHYNAIFIDFFPSRAIQQPFLFQKHLALFYFHINSNKWTSQKRRGKPKLIIPSPTPLDSVIGLTSGSYNHDSYFIVIVNVLPFPHYYLECSLKREIGPSVFLLIYILLESYRIQSLRSTELFK